MSGVCARPIEPEELADYWFGELGAPDEERVEEHLLGCGACSARLQQLAALEEGVRQLARIGAVEVAITPAFLRAAARDGLRTREYRVAPGERVACTVTPDDDLIFARLVADFEGVSEVDVSFEIEGRKAWRIEDVPVGSGAGELLISQSMPMLHGLGPAVMRVRLLTHGEAQERLLGEYLFQHTPTSRR